MKLYLSSIGIPNTEAFKQLFSGDSLSVAVIPNAWDVYPDERRQEEVEKTVAQFTSLGFKVDLTDLRTVTDGALQDELAKHSLVWTMGGNSFYLNEQVRKSGMAGFIKQLLEDGLVYGGESAGAVLACPTLHGVELLDDPKKASKTIWDGLKLVDFGIVPHWGMDKYAELLEKCKAEMEKHIQVKTISNDQAIVVEDGKFKLVDKE